MVFMLMNDMLNKSTHSVNFDAGAFRNRIYRYWLTAGSITITQKMTLIN